MAFRSNLLNRSGQIIIESVFLALVVAMILIVFKQLIEFQKNRHQFKFSPKKEVTDVSKYSTHAPE